MKQLSFGIGLLVFLLICGIWLGSALEESLLPVVSDLEKAADCAMEGNWDLAAARLARAEKAWQSRQKAAAVLVHHEPLDEIDLYFIRLKLCRISRSPVPFSTACWELAGRLRNLSQSHRFSWWRFL